MKKEIMKMAWALYKSAGCSSKAEFSLALKAAWTEYKNKKTNVKNVVVATFGSYNSRRYSMPWIAKVEGGRLDFNNKIGAYYNNDYSAGSGGELIVTQPQDRAVYGYGQKDYKGSNTFVEYVTFINGEFVECDKFGKNEKIA